MPSKLLLAIDRGDASVTAVDFTIGLATTSSCSVHVVHIREMPISIRVPPLETMEEAYDLVIDALRRLHDAGIHADGEAHSGRETRVARQIVDEATRTRCDAIILGSLRRRGIDALSGRGTRERVLKMSPLPVIVTPPTLSTGRSAMASMRLRR